MLEGKSRKGGKGDDDDDDNYDEMQKGDEAADTEHYDDDGDDDDDAAHKKDGQAIQCSIPSPIVVVVPINFSNVRTVQNTNFATV